MSDITYYCEICSLEFNSRFSLNGHKRTHGPSEGKLSRIYCCEILSRKVVSTNQLDKVHTGYLKVADKTCPQCLKPLVSHSRQVKFCSRSCSAIFNNNRRGPKRQNSQRKSIPIIRKKKFEKLCASDYKNIEFPYTKIFFVTCKHCSIEKFSNKAYKFCESCRNYYAEKRNLYKFTFNVFHYPDLFNLEEIKSKGFYSPGGRAGRWNIQGLSRDHKVSVSESLKNGYDPIYIRHPLNCEIMSHSLNNKKKHRSSISYSELVKLVNEYEGWF